MKIGIALDDSLDRPDGVQQYVLTIGEWLSQSGHEVHYLASSTTRNDLPGLHSLAKNIRVRFNHNVLRVPLPASTARLRATLASLDLDVLHVQMPYSPLFVGRLITAAPKNTAIISTFHILPANSLAQAGARALGRLQKKSLKKLDRTLAVSSPAAAFASKAFDLQTDVVPNAVATKHFEKTQDDVHPKHPSAIDIRYLGRLVRRKGVKELVDAFAHVVAVTKQPVHLTIGGRGELLDDLQNKVEQQQLSEHVTFAGFIDEKDKPSFLAHADIAVFPALGGESFGIVLLEAMAAKSGVVLAGDNAGYRSVMDDDRFILNNTLDPEAFANQLLALVENASHRQTIHNEQNELVKRFDVQVVGKKLEAIYHEAIAKHKSN